MLHRWGLTRMELDFDDSVAVIVRGDPRYDAAAYRFVRDALDATVTEVRKSPARAGREGHHVTGPELLDGIRAHALERFGPLAHTVLTQWGLRQCRDFGHIVFNLIEAGVFSKTEADRVEDFEGRYDFDEAFLAPFRPSRPRDAMAAPAAAAEPSRRAGAAVR